MYKLADFLTLLLLKSWPFLVLFFLIRNIAFVLAAFFTGWLIFQAIALITDDHPQISEKDLDKIEKQKRNMAWFRK